MNSIKLYGDVYGFFSYLRELPDDEFEDKFLDFVLNGFYINLIGDTGSEINHHITFEHAMKLEGMYIGFIKTDERFNHYCQKYKLLTGK